MLIYICDDDTKMLQDISKRVKELEPLSEVKTFRAGAELLEMLEKVMCDVLLLDIDMPDINGMDIARWLMTPENKNFNKNTLLIFVTTHDELVYESFRYHPFGFVRKNYFYDEIEKILIDCVRELEGKRRHFCFRTEGKDIRIVLSDIKYFEADSNYLKLYTDEGEYRFRSTMSAVENTLAHQGFIRIHKGFLVNQAAVRSLSADWTNLLDGTVLPMGKTYVDEAKNRLMRYMR